MPGRIHVSILGLEGLPLVSPSSSLSIKVSVGKQVYEIQGKGDFSFPLSNLCDKMILKIQDHEGNEIANIGIQTRLIAEKGFWDDLFTLEGGGQVHMTLQFILSEEERNKIRIMRESALRKKQEELLNNSTRNNSGNAITIYDSHKDGNKTSAITERNAADVKANKLLNEASGKIFKKQQAAPSFTGRKNEDVTSATLESIFQEAHSFRIFGEASSHSAGNLRSRSEVTAAGVETQHDDPGRQDAMARTPSNKLRRKDVHEQEDELDVGQTMRKAHLGSVLSRESGSLIAVTMSTKTVEHKLGREHNPAISHESQRHGTSTGRGQENVGTCGPLSKGQHSQNTEHLIGLNNKSHDEMSNEKNGFRPVNKSKFFVEDQRSSNELLHRPSTCETKSDSESDQLAKLRYSSENWMSKENKGKFGLELSQHSECPEVSCMTERSYSDSSSGWMFLNEAVCSCIVSDSRLWLYQFEQCSSDLMNSEFQQRKWQGGKNSKSNNSPKAGAPKGQPGKAIKFAIMAGFGILVLFTRQRQPR